MSLKGIDVSHCNGRVDWQKAKAAGLQFAILQMGYGGDSTKQDDVQFARNVSECERLGIPWGAYLYSYARTVSGAQGELQHMLRLLRGHHPQYPAFVDMEDADGYKARNGGIPSKATNTAIIKTVCDGLQKAGYKAGYYVNKDWYENRIDPAQLKAYAFWYARPGVSAPDKSCDIWQSEFGELNGSWPGANIPGKGCDLNVSYKNYALQESGTSAVKMLPALAPSNAAFTSDTTTAVSIMHGQSYTAKITCPAGLPSVTAGTGGVVDITYQSRNGSAYYYKLTATGKVGAETGIYINGHKPSTMVVRVATACGSDTTVNLSRKVGECYTVGLTCAMKPVVTAGTGGIVTIAGVYANGAGKWLCPIVAVRSGVTGIYTEIKEEGSPVKRFEFKVV
ncbi:MULTISPECIES: glycoside hydrolase family 25 protein [Caproicibacterium]|uniref:Glycoside hydrolase family 25 protein n=1 Tax=Caproicibacterium argilliputei TaxID=3030016 RepID=A0AA97DC14_9FIRM|nr:glycoside hydrolase family 25 protein [Caproicibacterium argilliputei]WOC32828.1 glycoside hydrolase family 25 protein [Caproicibacterium argilliputei]